MAELQPLGVYVVAQNDEAESKTASGLFVPESAKQPSQVATVAAVGDDVTAIKAGDRIVYKSYSTIDIKLGDTEYVLIDEADVLAKVN